MERTANGFFSNIWEEAMRRKRESVEDENTRNKEVRVELKYCERCGGLWLRECGTGEVYCGNCQAQVADLPIPKKKPQRVGLPVRRSSLIEDYSFKKGNDDLQNDDSLDFEAAAGGVA
jgi:Zn-finger nucleic acid-binding protein